MAWRTSNAVEGLMFTLNNNDVVLPTWTNAPVILEEPTRMLADPLGRNGSDIAPNNMFSERYPERYAAGLAAGPGSFNLQEYFYGIEVGQTFYIWQQATGRNVRLQFYRMETNRLRITFYVYGTTYGGRDLYLSQINPSTEYSKFPFAFLGFYINDELEQGTLYYGTEAGTRYDRYEFSIGRQTFVGFGDIRFDPTNAFYNMIHGHEVDPPEPGGGPYGDDDYDEPIGGDGDHDETSDTIDTSPIPIAAATRCGMVTAFVPTWGEVQSVADALLDPNIFQVLSSTVVRAADVIIGLSTFPCTVPATNTATVTANFLGLNIGTGVVAHVADDQYLEVNCGDLTINEYWGNCLDYNPYTAVSIFLPFCGMYELDVDEVMGKTLNVTYRVDIFSGACLATIKIDGSVFYQYTGQCSSQIPLNSVSFDNFLSSMLDIGIATATGVAAVKGAAGAVAESEKAFSDAKTSEVKGALEDVFAARDKYTKVKENSGANMLNAAVSSVIGGKGQYSHAGAMGGSPGFLAVKTPFVIIKRPEQVIPSMYGKFHGYPANTTANLGDLSGYTVVSDIRLNIPDATVDEIIECEQLLKGGVVL